MRVPKRDEKLVILYEDGSTQVSFDDSMVFTQRGRVFADGLKPGDTVDNRRIFRGYAPAQCLGSDWGQWGVDDRCPHCRFGQECWQDTPPAFREETGRILEKSW